VLKVLAVLFMVVDHVGVFLVPPSSPWYWPMRMVGRLAFPIFAYGVALGFTRTRSPYRYLLRMALWAVVGEVLIKGAALASGVTENSVWGRIDIVDWINGRLTFGWTNVLVEFTFAIVMLGGLEIVLRSSRDMVAGLRPVGAAPGGPHHFGVRFNPAGLSFHPVLGIPLGLFLAVVPFFAVTWLKADYDVFGLLAVLCFYLPLRRWPPSPDGSDPCRDPRIVASATSYVLLNLLRTADLVARYQTFRWTFLIEALSCLSLFLIFLPWKERRPTKLAKHFFYVFYPVHFALLVVLHAVLFP
jgi:hypothetical protein